MCNFPGDNHPMPIYHVPISSCFLFDNQPSSSDSPELVPKPGESTETFVKPNLLKNPKKEICSFDNADIATLRASGAFSNKAIIRPFDRTLRSDVSSGEWICFPAYPFSLGLRYPFPKFMMQFFRKTGLSFYQTMPMVWRVLIVLNQIKTLHIPDLCIEDIPIDYRLRSHGSSRFLLFPLLVTLSSSKQPKMRTDGNESFSLSGEIPSLRVTTFRLAPPTEESEETIKAVYRLTKSDKSFSSHLPSSSQYSSSDMSEPSPKPATSSKPTSSKAATISKPSPATKARASSAPKRKETDSHATPETFPYENHGFVEASGFMTSFLNQVKILILYPAYMLVMGDFLFIYPD
ncbi:hypothetical protein Hanom_Chr09g00798021 [Helianthus anomalus]